MKQNKRGIIYIATGEDNIRDAIFSAKSIKKHSPEINITLYTDKINITSPYIDQIEEIETNFFQKKLKWLRRIQVLSNSPYEETLYLDADTYALENLGEIFKLLKKYDLIVAFASKRVFQRPKNIPNSFPEMNAGIILYKMKSNMKKLFGDWEKFYSRNPLPHDQPALREALWESNIKLGILPEEYNIRSSKRVHLWIKEGIPNKIRILHMKSLRKRSIIIRYAKYFNKQSEIYQKTNLGKPFHNKINLKITLLFNINKLRNRIGSIIDKAIRK